ncbi:hypothetical protein [Hungatella hathewayi]|uniref:Uncharacterized protein n=2 Tax=Hungatella hathewayi TaxID=154046 RepID=G5IAF0_9FIRM|nr:hypothetical protein [Hungatella hathewayi]EHI61507.1 hypothetical protein HMPREF9473_00530 [ [Hungatella hathewayi WAL-18680]
MDPGEIALSIASMSDSEYEYAVRYLDGEAYYKGKALVDEMYASVGEVMSSPLGMLAEALGMFGTGGGGSVSYGMAGNSVAGIQMGSSLELSNGIVIGVGVLAAAGEAGSIMESDGNARAEENRKKAEKAAERDSETQHMLGENGTDFESKTTWQNGKTERLDVENPAPGERPGQIHYHDAKNNK